MATSTCIKCGGTFFEIQENTPNASNFKLLFVQCANCGGVIGVIEFLNISHELQLIKKKLGIS